MIQLRKNLEFRSLRWIGKQYLGLSPRELPIATQNISELEKSIGGESYGLGRYKPSNAILLKVNELYYAYVNPKYSGYRGFFKSFIKQIPNGHDVDHVLARNIAKKLNYSYVLICAIPGKVNKVFNGVCFSDERIYNKVLSRSPLVRSNKQLLLRGFSTKAKPQYGLTLSQRGLWNSAFCFHMIDFNNVEKRTKYLK